MTCREAIKEVFENEDGILTTRDVVSKIYKKYPDEPWKKSSISAHLIGLSLNHPSSDHYPAMKQHAFLFSLGNGRYRRWNASKDVVPVFTSKGNESRKQKKRPADFAIRDNNVVSDDKAILERIFGIVSFFDSARWEKRDNYNLINFYDSLISNDAKLLTHWLCYITDRQMEFERIWDVGGFIFSELVDEMKRTGSLRLLDPDHEGSFFIKRKNYLHKDIFSNGGDGDKYLFVSQQQVGSNRILLEYGFRKDAAPFFISRYYPSDYFSMLNTFRVLQEYGFSLTAYIIRLLEAIGDDNSHLISKLVFGMYLLTYEGIGQPKHTDIAFANNVMMAQKRARRIEGILSEKAVFEREFENFSADGIFKQKRAWCSFA
jgi:hypothetical protein